MKHALALALVFGVAATVSAQAADVGGDLQEILAISKTAGVCGVMQQMVAFQSTTKMPGGDEFIVRFWTTEFARLGKSQEQFIRECELAIARYDAYWKAFDASAK